MSQHPFTTPPDTKHKMQGHLGGVQHKFTFPNKRGASVIRHDGSYGHEDGLWELAVLDASGDLDYSTSITSDVEGWLDEAKVSDLLAQIAALPVEAGA